MTDVTDVATVNKVLRETRKAGDSDAFAQYIASLELLVRNETIAPNLTMAAEILPSVLGVVLAENAAANDVDYVAELAEAYIAWSGEHRFVILKQALEYEKYTLYAVGYSKRTNAVSYFYGNPSFIDEITRVVRDSKKARRAKEVVAAEAELMAEIKGLQDANESLKQSLSVRVVEDKEPMVEFIKETLKVTSEITSELTQVRRNAEKMNALNRQNNETIATANEEMAKLRRQLSESSSQTSEFRTQIGALKAANERLQGDLSAKSSECKKMETEIQIARESHLAAVEPPSPLKPAKKVVREADDEESVSSITSEWAK